jgi:Icc-related predicted phosphoesterase
MKIVTLSDLHVDSGTLDVVFPKDIDVCVVAGDTANNPETAMKVINAIAERVPHVVAVDGNHEHYSNAYDHITVDQTVDKMVDLAAPNVRILNRRYPFVEIDGFRFVGCNGWYSFDAGGGDPIENRALWKRFMNDCRTIGFDTIEQEQPWDRALNDARSMDAFINDSTLPVIAVTHTAPHRDMVTWKPHDMGWDRSNSFFVNSHMTPVLEKHTAKIKAWINGHTHHRKFVRIGETDMICNPCGYGRSGEREGWEPRVFEY